MNYKRDFALSEPDLSLLFSRISRQSAGIADFLGKDRLDTEEWFGDLKRSINSGDIPKMLSLVDMFTAFCMRSSGDMSQMESLAGLSSILVNLIDPTEVSSIYSSVIPCIHAWTGVQSFDNASFLNPDFLSFLRDFSLNFRNIKDSALDYGQIDCNAIIALFNLITDDPTVRQFVLDEESAKGFATIYRSVDNDILRKCISELFWASIADESTPFSVLSELFSAIFEISDRSIATLDDPQFNFVDGFAEIGPDFIDLFFSEKVAQRSIEEFEFLSVQPSRQAFILSLFEKAMKCGVEHICAAAIDSFSWSKVSRHLSLKSPPELLEKVATLAKAVFMRSTPSIIEAENEGILALLLNEVSAGTHEVSFYSLRAALAVIKNGTAEMKKKVFRRGFIASLSHFFYGEFPYEIKVVLDVINGALTYFYGSCFVWNVLEEVHSSGISDLIREVLENDGYSEPIMVLSQAILNEIADLDQKDAERDKDFPLNDDGLLDLSGAPAGEEEEFELF